MVFVAGRQARAAGEHPRGHCTQLGQAESFVRSSAVMLALIVVLSICTRRVSP